MAPKVPASPAPWQAAAGLPTGPHT